MKNVLIIGVILLLVLVIGGYFLISKGGNSNIGVEPDSSDISCKSKIDCASITDLRTPYHSCSLNNGCEMRDEKCISVCEGKGEEECISTTLSSVNPNSINPDEIICEWK